MNVKLLRRIQKHILAEPRRYFQNDWVTTSDVLMEVRNGKQGAPPCATMGCIAGWACILDGANVAKLEKASNNFANQSIINRAKKALRLTTSQAIRLFTSVSSWDSGTSSEWPKKFSTRYVKAKTPRGRVNAAIARIDHFIKTKGAQ